MENGKFSGMEATSPDVRENQESITRFLADPLPIPKDYSKVNVIAKELSDDECNVLMAKLQRRKKIASLKDVVLKSAYLDFDDRLALEKVLKELSGK